MRLSNIDRLSGHNPLRGLTLDGLVNYLEMGERGYYADLQWLYRLVLKRSGVARAVRRKLTGAIGRLDWDIKVPDDLEGERKTLAERQQDFLRAAYDGIENFSAARVHLAMADILGFSHLEKIYARAGADRWAVTELRVVEQWLWCRDGLFAPWEYNPQAQSTNRGKPIDRRHWVIREVEDPAAEIFALAHIKMSVTDADWDQFCDTYAVNPIFVEQPPNVPRNQEADYQRIAEEIVSDGRGSLPHGAKIHTVTPGTAGESVFTERLRWYREEIVLAGTGGILTTLDGNTGIGKGPADEHGDAWLDIAAEIGLAISETLNTDLTSPWLEREFPGQEQLAYFELEPPVSSPAPGAALADARTAKEAGFQVDADELSEKSGYKLTLLPADPSSAPPTASPVPPASRAPAVDLPPRNQAVQVEPDPGLLAEALAQSQGLEARWLSPVADVFRRIEAMLMDDSVPIEEVEAAVKQASDSMPALLGKMDVQALAKSLEISGASGALSGLADGLALKAKKTPKTTSGAS